MKELSEDDRRFSDEDDEQKQHDREGIIASSSEIAEDGVREESAELGNAADKDDEDEE